MGGRKKARPDVITVAEFQPLPGCGIVLGGRDYCLKDLRAEADVIRATEAKDATVKEADQRSVNV